MSDNNNSNLDEKYYRKISISDTTTSLPSTFPEKMASAIVENRIPRYQAISSDQVRKDLDQISGIRDPIMQTEIIKHIRLNPQIETETIGLTYDSNKKDWTHYLKRKE
jgi:hypothetical protein